MPDTTSRSRGAEVSATAGPRPINTVSRKRNGQDAGCWTVSPRAQAARGTAPFRPLLVTSAEQCGYPSPGHDAWRGQTRRQPVISKGRPSVGNRRLSVLA